MSFRAGLFLGSCAALLATAPAAYRVAQNGASGAAAWLLLAGGSALLLGPIVAFCRAARPLSDALQAALLGAALCAVPLSRFAELLEHGTHHRPLGAVTFAIVSSLLLMTASFVCWRTLVWLKGFELGA
ncbi:MAG TPA: hypothetical protein VGP93_03685, partial [Polyangiaceae bacterium]|nr:hypothetical protein [Polyangiaceae bacterium]